MIVLKSTISSSMTNVLFSLTAVYFTFPLWLNPNTGFSFRTLSADCMCVGSSIVFLEWERNVSDVCLLCLLVCAACHKRREKERGGEGRGTVIKLRNSCSASIANASRRWSVRFISNVDAICRNNERGRRRVAILTITTYGGSQGALGGTRKHTKNV